MKNTKLLLLMKIGIFISFITLTLLPYSIKIHDFQKKYEPRRSLLNHANTEGSSFALIGDSEFCSYYVNDDNDTIWKKFESKTGNKCFPGALDAVKRGDLIKAAKYISSIIPANSVIFIDIIPTRLIMSDNNEEMNYKYEWIRLLKEQENYLYYYYEYFKYIINYIDVDYFKYTHKIFNNITTDRESGVDYNRTWNIDGEFALNRYIKFKDTEIKYTPKNNINFLKNINYILLDKNIRCVFVITPLNKEQIFKYSDKDEAKRIYSLLTESREETKNNLNRIHAEYIDLYDAVPSNCFADLVHTNACGDEIIARSLADYASHVGR